MTVSDKAPPIDISPAQWEIVKTILLKNIPEKEIWAFGSRVTGQAKPYSDLDLAIIGDKPLKLDTSASLNDDFSESDLPWKVDIVDWVSTSDNFKKIIKQKKVVIQHPKANFLSRV